MDMKQPLKGSNALVTGGAVRIGRAIAQALARAGCNVVVHYRESEKEAAACCRELQRMGARAWPVRADLSSEAGCERLIQEAFKKAKHLNVLVNNAAVFHACPLERIDAAALQEEFQTNLFAPILLTRYFAQATNGGAIVNLLDRRIAALDPERIPYVLSKKSLADFTRSAALALAPHFTVNGVAPGPVLPPPGKPRAHLRTRAGRIPLAATVAPEEVARAVVYLASTRAITGQTLFVDGGQHLLGERV